MSDLRNRLIRLAAAKPELRADLLPLLKEQADPASHDQNKPESYYGMPPKGKQAARKPKGVQASTLPSDDDIWKAITSDGDYFGRGYWWVTHGSTNSVDLYKIEGRTAKPVTGGVDWLKSFPRGDEFDRVEQLSSYSENSDFPIGGGFAGPFSSVDAAVKALLPRAPKFAASGRQAGTGRTAKLMARQESILQKYMNAAVASGVRAATGWDELPDNVRAALRQVKDQETLWMDVDRWFADNAPASRYRWASRRA